MTPLYKKIKQNGTTLYVFQSAIDDIASSEMSNVNVYFTKFALLNLPKQNISNDVIDDYYNGVQNSTGAESDKEPVVFDFKNAFYKSDISQNSTYDFSEQIVESLRNYVANQDETIRNTKIDNNTFFYNPNVKNTVSERLFFKWAKKLNLIQFEVATKSDDYLYDSSFDALNQNDDTYQEEYLWKEREVYDYSVVSFSESGEYTNKLSVKYNVPVNYKVGDIVLFKNFTNINIASAIKGSSISVNDLPSYVAKMSILNVSVDIDNNYIVVFDLTYNGGLEVDNGVVSNLYYNRLVNYIGEISVQNNVKNANTSHLDVMANIDSESGMTPTVLFRTLYDENYEANNNYPILAEQYQSEILGAESFESPIVSNPSLYPGDYYAQYDRDNNNNEFVYINSSGDIIRRTGDYFGVYGDVNNTTFNGSKIDGVSIDFNTKHYSKMNLSGIEVSTFNEFSKLKINGTYPKDFEFNAILWYYSVVDNNGVEYNNLYGIEFLDNPNNNQNQDLKGIKIPTYNKLVTTTEQDGTSYIFRLKKSYQIGEEVFVNTVDDSAIALFGFDLYNELMSRMATLNTSFNKIINDYHLIVSKVNNLSQYILSQGDITTINKKLNNIQRLLLLYRTNQIVDSDTIEVSTDDSGDYPKILLNNVDVAYHNITEVLTSSMYDGSSIIPLYYSGIKNKSMYLHLVNDDTSNTKLADNNLLSLILTSDLSLGQEMKIKISSSDFSTINKKLNIYVQRADSNGTVKLDLMFNSINLPVYFNSSANKKILYANKDVKCPNININKIIYSNGKLNLYVSGFRGFNIGDNILVSNLIFNDNDSNFSNQYVVDNIELNSYSVYNTTYSIKEYIVTIDISSNDTLKSYLSTKSNNQELIIASEAYINFNKGLEISILRINGEVSDNDSYILDIKNV